MMSAWTTVAATTPSMGDAMPIWSHPQLQRACPLDLLDEVLGGDLNGAQLHRFLHERLCCVGPITATNYRDGRSPADREAGDENRLRRLATANGDAGGTGRALRPMPFQFRPLLCGSVARG